jgi:hypothetical protein
MTNLKKVINQTLLDSLDEIFTDNTQGWIENPVPFRVFVESGEHMSFEPLSERQYEVADFMLSGDDPKKIFENDNNTAVLVFGKGAGKDMLASLIILYLVYWLLCLEKPQRYFGLPEGEAIDIINVAVNALQASDVFFEKMKQRVLRWAWLKERYSMKISGVFLGQIKAEDFSTSVLITKNGVLFPKNIRAFSGHSETESQEGKNVLCYVCDEISGFDTDPRSARGLKLFDMLRSSAVSRFGQRYKSFCLSYPRFQGDAILKLYDIYKDDLHCYTDIGSTWDIKPAHLFKDYPEKYFEFDGQKVPLEYKKEFDMNPTEARGRYMCQPAEMQSAFIDLPEKLEPCVDYGRPSIVSLENYVEDNQVKKRITFFNNDNITRDYIVTIDLGLKSDSAAMSVFHKETKESIDYYIQDLVTSWIPDSKAGIVVSMTNIEEVLRTLKNHINITSVFFDQWNSSLLTQRLSQAGFYSTIYNLKFQDYKNMKEKLYTGQVRLLHDAGQLSELKRLILLTSGRVDHPVDGQKDKCDTICGAVKILSGDSKGTADIPVAAGGQLIGENLSNMGGQFV